MENMGGLLSNKFYLQFLLKNRVKQTGVIVSLCLVYVYCLFYSDSYKSCFFKFILTKKSKIFPGFWFSVFYPQANKMNPK